MKLYFGNTVSTVTTLMLLTLLGFIGYSAFNRSNISFWGRRTLALAIYGLVICCFAAARDGYDKSVAYAIDGTGAPGIFSLTSITVYIAYIGAAVIIIAGIATLFLKSQHVKEMWFYIMSAGVLLKFFTVEISRIMLYISGKI